MAISKDTQRATMERRDFKLDLAKCEVRSADGDQPATFNGYAAVFDSLSVNLGGFRERIQAGAFRGALAEGDDVRFLINHDSNQVLGRSKSGTITLAEDEVGLRVECELPNTTFANDLVEMMSRGDVDQMSFGFQTVSDAWNERDGETGLPIRELIEARLFDVSVVTYPAYSDTTAEVRSLIAENTPELLERAAQAAEELETRDEPAVELPSDDVVDEAAASQLRKEYEEQRAEAGVRIEDDHPQCDGVAVVWNFNDEMQSCHSSREAAEAQIEAMTSGAAGAARAGKVLSADNATKITEAMTLLHGVMSAAGMSVPGLDDMGGESSSEANETIQNEHKPEGETRDEEISFPNIEEFAAAAAERGWSYDDDWAIWSLTSMIQSASCYLLYEGGQGDDDDDEADDAADAATMNTIIEQLTALLAKEVAEAAARKADPAGEAREAEAERDAETVARERRDARLRLLEAELV